MRAVLQKSFHFAFITKKIFSKVFCWVLLQKYSWLRIKMFYQNHRHTFVLCCLTFAWVNHRVHIMGFTPLGAWQSEGCLSENYENRFLILQHFLSFSKHAAIRNIHIAFSTAPAKWKYLFRFLFLLKQGIHIGKGE